MPRSSGTYSAPASSWNPTTNGATATKADWDALLADLAAALTQSIAIDGQSTPTGNLPMGGFKLTGLAAGSANGNSVRFEQLHSPTNILPIDSGGTGAATAVAAIAALGGSPRATRIDVASVAGTVDLTANAPSTDDIRITGALAITAFTVAVGRVIRVVAGGAFTLTNNANIVTQRGANIVAVAGDTFMLRATAANVVEVLDYSAVLGDYGVPRTWQDMTASRASATDYTNSTGREIFISVTSGAAAATDVILTVSGLQVARSTQNSTSGISCASTIVPAGAVYRAVVVGGITWMELR